LNIKLPQRKSDDFNSVEFVITQRESKREYLDTPVSLENLSRLLFAAQGMRGNGAKLVTPSAHEQYPIATYVVSRRVTGIEPGFYQYDNKSHSVDELLQGEFSTLLEKAALGEQPWIKNAAAIIVFAGNIESMNKHFADQPPLNARGERYNYIEVGAIAQNMQLQGTALDIGMVLVGGFNNTEVKDILQLPQSLEPSALVCIGNV